MDGSVCVEMSKRVYELGRGSDRDDVSAVVCELLSEQGVVVVQCGDRGGGGVKASMEIGAFAFLGSEFEAQFVDFLVAAGRLGIYGAALSDLVRPIRRGWCARGSWSRG
jgi:hypothetical protein